MALVQALLGAKRDRRGRPYLRDHVTGKYDQATATALMGYRMDQRDGSIKRPLNARGSLLSKLAQGQSLAVPEGTAMPYKIATLAEPGPIKGPAAKYLSAERKVELKQVMKEFISGWGIAFDVEVKGVTGSARSNLTEPFESGPLVAHFTPRNLWVRLPRGLSAVPNSAQFRARAKALYEIVEADLKARCVEAFAIEDPVDVKIQQGLKDDLACVVRTDLEGVEALAQSLLAVGRLGGPTLPVRFFENYLNMKEPFIRVSRDEAIEFDLITNAAAENIERFKDKTFISLESSNAAVAAIEEITKNPKAEGIRFQDEWKSDFNLTAAGLRRFAIAGATDFVNTFLFVLAFGQSSVISTGVFDLTRQDDRILVTGTITHVLIDVDGYNFNPGKFFHPESQILEKHGKAKPFKWEAEWRELVDGELQVGTFLPRAGGSQNLRRRWVRFETRPGT